jgi:AcrR family transcriptional regulator
MIDAAAAGRPAEADAPSPATRRERKERTRQALLDAALALLEEQSLSSLGLREVTRAVGVAPAAFYRHFTGTAELGVALVEQALGSLHALVRAVLAEGGGPSGRIDRTVAVIARHVELHRAHVRFVARERHGGVAAVRDAIATQLAQFAAEVADGLAAQPLAAGWAAADLRMLAGLYVDLMLMTATAFLETAPGPVGDAARAAVARDARRRLNLVHLGRRHWLDDGPGGAARRA